MGGSIRERVAVEAGQRGARRGALSLLGQSGLDGADGGKAKAMLHARRGRQLVASAVLAAFATELRAWHGREPLWRVFWGYGVLASAILALLYVLAVRQERVIVQQILLVLFAGYTAWILVAVWRCAENSDALWRALARSLTVAWAANTVLVLAFLQLDLPAAYMARRLKWQRWLRGCAARPDRYSRNNRLSASPLARRRGAEGFLSSSP